MTIISQSVEISIAGGGEEILRAYLLVGFFFLLFFIFLFSYHVVLVKVQELTCSASYSVKKTLIPNNGLLHLSRGKIKLAESIGKIPLR